MKKLKNDKIKDSKKYKYKIFIYKYRILYFFNLFCFP